MTSFARSLVRSETELILAVDGQGEVAMQTGEVPLASSEREELAAIAGEGRTGWLQLQLGGADRVAQVFRFEPFGWHLLITERRDAFYSAVDRIFNQALFILGGSMAVALVLLLLLALYLTRPLGGIIRAMREIITSGDLSRRVEVLYRDETGELGHTFNLMSGALQKAYEGIKKYARDAVIAQMEERKTNTIFQKYVPPAVIEELKKSPESRLGRSEVLAILFSDIRGFTTIAESMDSKEIVDLLNDYYTRMADVIYRHEGTVDKYMGDGLLATFGAPVKHDDDASRAVFAALDMLEDLQEFNRRQEQKGRKPIRIGIGIDYRPVTVGNIGHAKKKIDYTVIGDPVNLASRLEGATKQFGEPLLISKDAYYHVYKETPCRLLGRVMVKGRTVGDKVYIPRRALTPQEESAWKLHAEALERYYARDFEEAAQTFAGVERLLPRDPLAGMYRQLLPGIPADPAAAGVERGHRAGLEMSGPAAGPRRRHLPAPGKGALSRPPGEPGSPGSAGRTPGPATCRT